MARATRPYFLGGKRTDRRAGNGLGAGLAEKGCARQGQQGREERPAAGAAPHGFVAGGEEGERATKEKRLFLLLGEPRTRARATSFKSGVFQKESGETEH